MNLRASSTFQAGDFARLEALLVPKLIVAAERGAKAVLEDSQVLVPVDTGELKLSAGTTAEWTGRTVRGFVSYSAKHAAYNEFGTGTRGASTGNAPPGISYSPDWPGMAAQPFLRPALDSARPRILEEFRNALTI